MNTIISIIEFAEELRDIAIKVCTQTHEVFNPDEVDWCGLAYLLCLDYISTLLEWRKPTNEFDWELSNAVNWYQMSGENEASALYSVLIDDVWLAIMDTIARYIPSKTYITWSAVRHGTDMILIRGEDYRILDWERCRRDGVIEDPRKKPNPRVLKKCEISSLTLPK